MADHDDDLPPSEEELAASARLRDALEGNEAPASEEAELAASLREAFAPRMLSKDENALLIDLALAPPDELAAAASLRDHGDPMVAALAAAWRPTALGEEEHRAIIAAALREKKERGVVIRVAFGAGGVLALAASVLLMVRTSAPEAPLARARSTQPLFDEPFKSGDASARIDRIALARASDYRDNRFTKWGVR